MSWNALPTVTAMLVVIIIMVIVTSIEFPINIDMIAVGGREVRGG